MSTASKVTLLSTILATAGIVSFVHWAQTAEKEVCTACLHQQSYPVTGDDTDRILLGHARRRHTRYGTAAHQGRTAGGFRNAEETRGRI